MAPPNDAAGWQPFHLPGARVRQIRAASNGSTYQLHVWVPDGTPPPGGYPVHYVLDANALFATFAEALRRAAHRPDATGIQPAIVVGIGWPGPALYAADARSVDYTRGPAAWPAVDNEALGGGAPAFLSFIRDELAPLIGRDFPVDPTQQTLFGHSLAGLFVLHALMDSHDFFRTYAAISPSLWWERSDLQARLGTLSGSRSRVLIAVGEWEDELPPWQRGTSESEETAQRRQQRRMVARARDFAAGLRPVLGAADVTFFEFPEEDHASVVAVAIQRVLRFASAASPRKA